MEELFCEVMNLINDNLEKSNERYHCQHIRMKNNWLFCLFSDEFDNLVRLIKENYCFENQNLMTDDFLGNMFVDEVIINAVTKNDNSIEYNLKENMTEFKSIIEDNFKEYWFYIPIEGIDVEIPFQLGSILLMPISLFKDELMEHNSLKDDVDITKNFFNNVKYCKTVAKIKIIGINEVAKEQALIKINSLVSILSLFKPYDIISFGINGEVKPSLNLLSYAYKYNDNYNISSGLYGNLTYFNLVDLYGNCGVNEYIDYLIQISEKEILSYVDKKLLNSIFWFSKANSIVYKKEEILLITKSSTKDFNYYNISEVLTKLITSIESIVRFKRSNRDKILENFNRIMSEDFSLKLNRLYDLRNDVIHGLLDDGVEEISMSELIEFLELVRKFIFTFIDIKMKFDNSETNNLESKEDLINYFTDMNIIK